jgi:predicted Rossmann-fold nucleotide-binding protein
VFGNIGGFWSPMIGLLDHMRSEGFIHTANNVKPLIIDAVEDIVPAILDAGSARRRGSSAEAIERL